MQTSSGLMIGYGSGAIFGPMLSSSLMSWIGPAALFAYIALNLLVMMFYAIYQSKVAGLQREKMEFVLQPSIQFPTDELYTAAQDDLTPVPEELYQTEEPVEGESVTGKADADETSDSVTGEDNFEDAAVVEEPVAPALASDDMAADGSATVAAETQDAEDEPITTESLIEAWEQEQLSEAGLVPESDEQMLVQESKPAPSKD
ncbi:hypothetical protein [Nitrincola sp. A-D6]|uniref:hypothetical protein n=1 Tax=Nitrincola sp. A-D6 TaxID=1545442 RepID=UPI002E0EC05E